MAEDLGLLLRWCSWVVVRAGSRAVLVPTDLLIGWRALQVVTGTPYLSCPERLRVLFPEAAIDTAGFHIPTQCRSPEEVLAACLTHRIPVAESRIIYRAALGSHRAGERDTSSPDSQSPLS